MIMLATSTLALILFGAPSRALGLVNLDEKNKGYEESSTIHYTTISGFFLQDDPATDPATFDYTTTNFGLINRTYPTDDHFNSDENKTQWQRFEHYVNTLNRNADEDTQYKVLFMGRHGEGYHNVAESYYGTPAWNCYWGPLDGNGTITWRDAFLTEAGIAQCTKANTFWKHALATSKIPAPQTYYSSPLIRSATTANLTFGDLGPSHLLPADRPFAPTIKELLREGISVRTCDTRSSRARLAALLPRSFRFEDGFAETDELWRGRDAEGETDDEQLRRTKAVFDDIFRRDPSRWISLTTHSGQIAGALKVLGHRAFALSTGQAIPALIEARTVRAGSPTSSSTMATPAFTHEVTCGAPPVTSVAGQGCVCSGTPSSSSVVVSATATVGLDG